MQEKQVILSQKVLIPLGAVVFLAGAIFWIAALYATSMANAEDIMSLQRETEKIKADNLAIIDRLARIETKMDLILNRFK